MIRINIINIKQYLMDGPKKRVKFFKKYKDLPGYCYNYMYDRNINIDQIRIDSLEKILNLNEDKYKISYQNIDKFNDKLSIKFIKKVNKNNKITKKFLMRVGIPGLPFDIVEKICQLINQDDFIEVIINLRYTKKYPFDAPLWELKRVLTNKHTGYNLKNIYKYWINVHNEIYQKEWSAVTTIDKDILNFMVRINFSHELLKSIE